MTPPLLNHNKQTQQTPSTSMTCEHGNHLPQPYSQTLQRRIHMDPTASSEVTLLQFGGASGIRQESSEPQTHRAKQATVSRQNKPTAISTNAASQLP
jgi:hypothetical protein